MVTYQIVCIFSDVTCYLLHYFRVSVNEVQNLHYLPRVSAPREKLVEDRTACHADHVGQGFDRATTAAVAVLKAVQSADDK